MYVCMAVFMYLCMYVGAYIGLKKGSKRILTSPKAWFQATTKNCTGGWMREKNSHLFSRIGEAPKNYSCKLQFVVNVFL
jgi:hypothetical protein